MTAAAQLVMILLPPPSGGGSRVVHITPGDREALGEALTLLGEFLGSGGSGVPSRVNPVAAQRSERSGEG